SRSRARPSLSTLVRVLSYAKGSKLYLWLVVLFGVLGGGLLVVAPYFTGDTIDRMMTDGTTDFQKILSGVIFLVALYGLGAVFLLGMHYLSGVVSARTAAGLRKSLYAKTNRLPIRFYDTSSDGDIETRFVYDVDVIADGLTQGLAQLFSATVTIAGTLVFMAVMSVKMTLMIIPLATLTVMTAIQIAKMTTRQFCRQQALVGELNMLSEEIIAGQREVKAFVYEDCAQERFERTSTQLFGTAKKAQFYSSLPNPSTRFLNHAAYVLIAVLGFFAGGLSVGQISAFILYWTNFSRPVNDLTNITSQVMAAFASAERVFEILDLQQSRNAEKGGSVNPKRIEGEVRFEDVSFSYTEDKPLIRDLSFTAKAGSTVAIVGPTGAGKTTLINLLLRFYEIGDGRIRIDGNDISDMNKDMLRSMFGMVLQDTWLFEGSVRDNLLFGKPDATEKEMIEAAKAVRADGFIRRLPDGYDTVLSENAENLSEGQRQLLSVTRVMLADPPMLILDEATSSVDSLTEQRIREAFDHLMKGRTGFVIAHRLSTIQNADLILVMKNGAIVEKGTHQELMDGNGVYAQMYGSGADIRSEEGILH
ncbi:MAG: ABC transporter ATP-binding protein, partial [Clostridiales bacterium]|nr:ABC transporter ATP-binding protein [Clostridiales bacterium]